MNANLNKEGDSGNACMVQSFCQGMYDGSVNSKSEGLLDDKLGSVI